MLSHACPNSQLLFKLLIAILLSILAVLLIYVSLVCGPQPMPVGGEAATKMTKARARRQEPELTHA